MGQLGGTCHVFDSVSGVVDGVFTSPGMVQQLGRTGQISSFTCDHMGSKPQTPDAEQTGNKQSRLSKKEVGYWPEVNKEVQMDRLG